MRTASDPWDAAQQEQLSRGSSGNSFQPGDALSRSRGNSHEDAQSYMAQPLPAGIAATAREPTPTPSVPMFSTFAPPAAEGDGQGNTPAGARGSGSGRGGLLGGLRRVLQRGVRQRERRRLAHVVAVAR